MRGTNSPQGPVLPEVPISDREDIPRVQLNEIDERLELEYPCRWLYKVIGWDEEAVRGAVLEVVDVEGLTMELSHHSSQGTYVSFNVEVTVESDEQRTGIYEGLKAHDAVRMVL